MGLGKRCNLGMGANAGRVTDGRYLGGELVDLGGDRGDGLGGLLEVPVAALLDEPPRLRLGVLHDDELGPVLDAGHVQERLRIPLLVLVQNLLVVRVETRLRRHQLLHLPCIIRS